ncbi:hypothetical protein C8R43DRAFT_1032415 [Mycena crocata]|nr:hypothetical protein C8R43DRAFT_1032415 [Mycena crocata]
MIFPEALFVLLASHKCLGHQNSRQNSGTGGMACAHGALHKAYDSAKPACEQSRNKTRSRLFTTQDHPQAELSIGNPFVDAAGRGEGVLVNAVVVRQEGGG